MLEYNRCVESEKRETDEEKRREDREKREDMMTIYEFLQKSTPDDLFEVTTILFDLLLFF